MMDYEIPWKYYICMGSQRIFQPQILRNIHQYQYKKAEDPLPKGLVVPFPSRSAMLRNSDAMIANAMASAKDCDLDLPLLGIHRSRDRCVLLGRLQRERRKEHSTKEDPKETAAQEWRCAELECRSFQHGRSNKMFGTHSNTTGRLTLWDPSQHLSMAWYSDFTKSSTQLQALRHRQIGTLPCPPYEGLPFRRFVQVTTGSLCRSIAAGGVQCNDSMASNSLERFVGRNRSAGSYRALVTTCLNDSCSCTTGSGVSGCEGHLVWNMHIYVYWFDARVDDIRQWNMIIHHSSM